MRPTQRVTMPATAAIVTLAFLAACGPSNPSAGPSAPSAPASPSPSAGASSSPDPARHEEIRAMVEAARLSPRQLGVKKPSSEETTFSLTVPCRLDLEANYVAAHYWSYRDAKVDLVAHSVFGFDPQRGADVIAQIKTALTSCRSTWTYGDSIRMKPAGELRVRRPAGVDGHLAYCHRGTVISGRTKGDTVYLCDGLVSRGSLVASVSTVELTLAAAQAELKKAIPLAAAALVRAVPVS